MPNPIVAMPDDELAVIQYLRARSEVTGLVPASRITTELGPHPIYPVVLIQRAGGTAVVRQAIDEAAVQVDVVGGTKKQCKDAAFMVRAAILAIANDVVAEAVLSSADEEVGPFWIPDTVMVPPLPRYSARYSVVLHK